VKLWLPAGAAVLLVGAVAVHPTSAQQAAPQVTTVTVERGPLSAAVSLDGTLTYRSPRTAINQARGIYTRLPAEGDKVGCGDVLYRVDDDPVLLLCGTVPAYRDLKRGSRGKDARQLERNLRRLHHKSIRALQRAKGLRATGTLELGDAVFLPGPVRIAKLTAKLGGFARPGAPVAQTTSDTLEVQVDLEASQQGAVRKRDRARVTLPGNRAVEGTVSRLGAVASAKDGDVAAATVPASITLDDPERARGLDRAPVQADIITEGVKDALSVPVTALVGKAGGGFAVEVVRGGGRRELVAVELRLFDATGRVEVEGALQAGDRVVVPSP
jgi:multidrug efflux pump subunit AcrA (membrane-fusion protein)